jgi:palmitoyl-protein thioesterase
MGDNCCHAFSMGAVKREIEKTLPGIYVYSVEVGNTTLDDTLAG